MFPRRAVLGLALSLASTGCVTDSLAENDERPTDVGADAGNPPPWNDPGSAMDVGVENRLDGDVEVTVEIADYTKSVVVSAGSTWVSDDVVDPGQTPTVALTVEDGREKRVTWAAEDENEGYLLFEVHPDRIGYEMAEKGEVLRTEQTPSPDPKDE
jgi:hypothetical protein